MKILFMSVSWDQYTLSGTVDYENTLDRFDDLAHHNRRPSVLSTIELK